MKTNYLLLLACSNLKNQSATLLTALERYNGGPYKIIRKMQREKTLPSNIEIKIISAEFGLIDLQTLIPLYDRKMDALRANELKLQIQTGLNQVFLRKKYIEAYVDLGQQYLLTLEEFRKPPETKFLIARGRIGERLANLKKWLESHREIK